MALHGSGIQNHLQSSKVSDRPASFLKLAGTTHQETLEGFRCMKCLEKVQANFPAIS